MNILTTSYTLKYKSLDIYLAGCSGNPHCTSCQNPETWDFNQGELYDDKYFMKLLEKNNDFNDMIENIMIFGGEPLDQDLNELIKFLTDLQSFNKKIWLFTRYELSEIPTEIISLCNYIKTGKYIPELKSNDNVQYGIKIATKNQKIFKIN